MQQRALVQPVAGLKPSVPGSRVIYLATCAEDDMLARAKLTEPFGYLLKPFSAQGLKASIKKGVIGCEATNRPF